MPSRTALRAAAHRAAHQLLEGGRVFADPLAVRILARDPRAIVDEARAHPDRRGMRFFIAARTRFAEDALAKAVAAGVAQVVILGAGLDTFAYRTPLRDRLRIFEVDHPATQAWKRERLASAGIAVPSALTYAPVDFERESLSDGLRGAGFDQHAPAFFTWLGVVPYLREEAVWSTLAFVAALRGAAEIVFDYGEPRSALSTLRRAERDARARHVAQLGEPWITTFDPTALHEGLRRLGFTVIDDLSPRDIAARYLREPAGDAPDRGGHVLRASTRA
ncbi:MAG TPA: SAM-dependent methyltransferase [Candidatus Baltobacteraceae bacterium]|nr:SAM-dependent methyltransferase [Candidatus Baltobacteraceae bacterium]